MTEAVVTRNGLEPVGVESVRFVKRNFNLRMESGAKQ